MGAIKTTLVKSAWDDDKSIDTVINEWLDNHNYCKLFDIKFVINNYNTEEALIIYCEDDDSYYNKDNELNLDKIRKDLALGKLTWVGDKLQRL